MNLVDSVHRLEARVLSAWSRAAAFRTRYSPDPSTYYANKHRALAVACQTVARLGATPWQNGDLGTAIVEQLALTGELAKHWDLSEPPLGAEPIADPDQDLARLQEAWALLRLKNGLGRIEAAIGAGSDLGRARADVVELLSLATVGEPLRAYSQADGLAQVLLRVTQQTTPAERCGIPTLDRFVGGVRPGDVWVLGAPTNWGKSSACIAIADHFKGRSLIVTCEDAPDLFFTRLMAKRANINGLALRDGKLVGDELQSMTEEVAAAKVAWGTTPFILDGRGHTVERIADFIRVACRVHGITLVICDYLQCMRTERKTEDRRQEINHIARTLTDVIKTSGAGGILTSQLTGENIRESQDVEHAAEVVLIGRKEDGKLSLYLKKSKRGPANIVIPMTMNKNTGAFSEVCDEWNEVVDELTDGFD